MQAVIVTGGAGYIGSHICKRLHDAGYFPVVLDNLSHGHREAVRWGELELGDVRDEAFVCGVFKRHAPQAVIHCAGLISVSESVAEPARYYSNNVGGTVALISAMKECGVKRVIFSSTCAVHGIPERSPISEDDACAPITPYGASKWMAERIIADSAKAYGFSYAHLRYFNAAGVDPEGEIGEMHDPETHAVPLAIAAAMKGEAFSLFGTDYETPDGTAIRDYVHVCDLADAHILAMEYLEKGGESYAINIGTGIGVSVRALTETVSRAAGKKLAVREAPRRVGDPPCLVADVSRAKDLLGFKPRLSDIDTIVQTAWNWHAADHNAEVQSKAHG